MFGLFGETKAEDVKNHPVFNQSIVATRGLLDVFFSVETERIKYWVALVLLVTLHTNLKPSVKII